MLVEEIQGQIDALGVEILSAYPELCLEGWSHPLGEATDFDGWTVGFVLRGLKLELELAVDFALIHSIPRVSRTIAEWLVPPDQMGYIWFDCQGDRPFQECRQAVMRALKSGVPEGPNLGATSVEVRRQFPESRISSILSCDEREVYDCWLDYHRQFTVVPPHLVRQSDSFGLFPKSEESRARLARLLDTDPEVVGAAFPECTVPPELIGPPVVPVELAWNVGDFRLLRQLYRDKPLCSGLLYVSPIGFAGNRAAMLVMKYFGANLHEMVDGKATGVSVVRFHKEDGRWSVVDSTPVFWRAIWRALFAGPLFLATADWAQLYEVDVSGDSFQPTLDLTWKLPDGRDQRLKVAPGSGGPEVGTIYVQVVAPGAVVEAVIKHFGFRTYSS